MHGGPELGKQRGRACLRAINHLPSVDCEGPPRRGGPGLNRISSAERQNAQMGGMRARKIDGELDGQESADRLPSPVTEISPVRGETARRRRSRNTPPSDSMREALRQIPPNWNRLATFIGGAMLFAAVASSSLPPLLTVITMIAACGVAVAAPLLSRLETQMTRGSPLHWACALFALGAPMVLTALGFSYWMLDGGLEIHWGIAVLIAFTAVTTALLGNTAYPHFRGQGRGVGHFRTHRRVAFRDRRLRRRMRGAGAGRALPVAAQPGGSRATGYIGAGPKPGRGNPPRLRGDWPGLVLGDRSARADRLCVRQCRGIAGPREERSGGATVRGTVRPRR